MIDQPHWQISGISSEARALARSAAQKRGVGVGDWLDTVIRQRTGLATPPPDNTPPGSTGVDALMASLPADLLDTIDDFEARIASQAGNVESLVVPLAETIDDLDARLHSIGDDAAAPRLAEDAATPGTPFYADPAGASDEDREIADATVAGNLDRLFTDAPGSAAAPHGAAPHATALPGTRDNPGHRTMLVAAAIVVTLMAVGFTLYQWAQVPTGPDPADTDPTTDAPLSPATETPSPVALPEPATTAPDSTPTTGSSRPPAALQATPGATVETGTRPATAAQPEQPDPSFTRPSSPADTDDSPLAALYRAAAGGDRRAQYDLAVSLIQGRGVPQDHAAASYWLRETATAGLAQAQYNLGVMYDLGIAGIKDPVEALLWFHAAADQNHARAYYALGLAYAEGKGIPANQKSARLWFTRGAEADVADAQLVLGIMYDQGLGGGSDPKQAYYWYRRAELKGNERASNLIAGLAERLTTAERTVLNDAVSRAVTPELARALPNRTTPTASTMPPAPPPFPPQIGTPGTADAPQALQALRASRDTVRSVQQLLAELGFAPGPADGDAGPRTRSAIIEYQRALELPVDGHASAALLTHLRKVTGRLP